MSAISCFSASLALSQHWVSRNKGKKEGRQAGTQGRQGFEKVDTPSNQGKQEDQEGRRAGRQAGRQDGKQAGRQAGRPLGGKLGNKLGDEGDKAS